MSAYALLCHTRELQLCASGVGESSPQDIKQMIEIVIRDK